MERVTLPSRTQTEPIEVHGYMLELLKPLHEMYELALGLMAIGAVALPLMTWWSDRRWERKAPLGEEARPSGAALLRRAGLAQQGP